MWLHYEWLKVRTSTFKFWGDTVQPITPAIKNQVSHGTYKQIFKSLITDFKPRFHFTFIF